MLGYFSIRRYIEVHDMIDKYKQEILEIITFNEQIEKLYSELASEEIKGTKGSNEYEKKISYIALIREVSITKLKNLHLSNEDIFSIDKYLTDPNLECEDYLADICNLSTKNAIKRTHGDLFLYANEIHAYEVEEIKSSEEDTSLEEFLLDEYAKQSDTLELLKDSLMGHTMIAYLEELIQKEENFEQKKLLIQTKYRIIYLYRSLETNFINDYNHFIQPEIYQRLVKRNIEVYPELYDEEYLEPLLDTIGHEVKLLVSLENPGDEFDKIRLMLHTIYIRTCISMINDPKTIVEVNKIINNLIAKTTGQTNENLNETLLLNSELMLTKNIDL